MRRFEAKQVPAREASAIGLGSIPCWTIIDNKTGYTIFGDNPPRDQKEAEQCARAISLALDEVLRDIVKAANIQLDKI